MNQETPKGSIFLGKETDSIENVFEDLVEIYELNIARLQVMESEEELREELSRLWGDVDRGAKLTLSKPPVLIEEDGIKKIVNESARAYVCLEWKEDGKNSRFEVSVMGGGEIMHVETNGELHEIHPTGFRRLMSEDEELEVDLV